jgi:hypothetical protein
VICLKCLRKEPQERYASAGALAEDLARFLDGKPIAARARSARERVAGWAGRRREYLFLLAGALLVAGAALGVRAWWPRPDPVRFGPTPVPASHLPPDLRLVPPDAFAFVTVHAADVWGNPAARELLDHHAGLRDAEFTHDAIGKELERITSIHPRDIERATFVFAQEGRNRGPLVVLFTAQQYSHGRLDAVLMRGGKHTPQEVGGKRIYVPTASKSDLSFLAYSDRILVLGEPDAVLEAATAHEHGVGPLTPVLERAAGTHTLVVGLRPSRETVAEALGSLGLGAEADPLVPLHTIGITADVTHPAGPNGRVSFDLAAEVAYPSAEQAEEARPHAPAAVRALVGAILRSRDGLSLVSLLGPLLEPVKSAAWERDGDTLRASARGGVDLAAVKSQLEEAIRQEKSVSGMHWIATAMRRYHDQHGRFPPAVVTDADGKPLYSWRVLLLPYLNEEGLYRRFHLNRAWDHPSNRPLLDQMPAAFAASGAKPGGNTTAYQVLTGSGGLFDAPEGRALTEITDGPANTILLVEAADAVPWTKPADVPLGDGSPKLGGPGTSTFLAVMADGTIRPIPRQTATPALLRGLFTRSGGEAVSPP